MYPQDDDAETAFLRDMGNNKPVTYKNKKSGGPADVEAAGAAGGAATGGALGGAALGIALLALVIGAVGLGISSWSVHNDNSLTHALRHSIQPVLEYVFNYTSAAVLTSQSFCSSSFTHVAYGTPASYNISLDKKRRGLGTREALDAEAAYGPCTPDELGILPERCLYKKSIRTTSHKSKNPRGFPIDGTILPGVDGVVTILRAGETVQVIIAATGYPADLADNIPVWQLPDVVYALSSFIRYECIPPIAAWPNCNDTIDNVAPCEELSADFDHSVYFGPFGREAVVNIQHTHITNGASWYLVTDYVQVTGSTLSNALADGDSDTDTDSGYLVGTQSTIFSSVILNDSNGNDELYFNNIAAQFHYKTDAGIDWEPPESCISTCL